MQFFTCVSTSRATCRHNSSLTIFLTSPLYASQAMETQHGTPLLHNPCHFFRESVPDSAFDGVKMLRLFSFLSLDFNMYAVNISIRVALSM
jgi:hypothetical protein